MMSIFYVGKMDRRKNLTAINLKNGEAIDCDIQLKDPSMTTIGDYFPN